MRETFLFLAGGIAGALIYPVMAIVRELYSAPIHIYRCECCGEPSDGYIESLGPVCADCELTIWKAEKINEHIK
jgi:hypothetical protein